MADWQTVSVFLAPVFLGYLVWLWVRYDNMLTIALRACFFVYVVGIISVTLFPMPVTAQGIAHYRALPESYQLRNNLIPLASIRETLVLLPLRPALVQLAGNFVMLLPLGYLAPLLWPRVNSLRRVAALTAITALSIETTQFAISLVLGSRYKSFDVDDLILNVLGGCLGYAMFRLLAQCLTTFDFTPTLRRIAPSKRARITMRSTL